MCEISVSDTAHQTNRNMGCEEKAYGYIIGMIVTPALIRMCQKCFDRVLDPLSYSQ